MQSTGSTFQEVVSDLVEIIQLNLPLTHNRFRMPALRKK
jgi:hypothetical protein